jgi:hypothetical protein
VQAPALRNFTRAAHGKEMLFYVERSRYVYENKQKQANLSDKKGDISAKLTFMRITFYAE